ncbi:hypothetical protein Q9189_006029 [Teloschistes chrysophthalmus]
MAFPHPVASAVALVDVVVEDADKVWEDDQSDEIEEDVLELKTDEVCEDESDEIEDDVLDVETDEVGEEDDNKEAEEIVLELGTELRLEPVLELLSVLLDTLALLEELVEVMDEMLESEIDEVVDELRKQDRMLPLLDVEDKLDVVLVVVSLDGWELVKDDELLLVLVDAGCVLLGDETTVVDSEGVVEADDVVESIVEAGDVVEDVVEEVAGTNVELDDTELMDVEVEEDKDDDVVLVWDVVLVDEIGANW